MVVGEYCINGLLRQKNLLWSRVPKVNLSLWWDISKIQQLINKDRSITSTVRLSTTQIQGHMRKLPMRINCGMISSIETALPFAVRSNADLIDINNCPQAGGIKSLSTRSELTPVLTRLATVSLVLSEIPTDILTKKRWRDVQGSITVYSRSIRSRQMWWSSSFHCILVS